MSLLAVLKLSPPRAAAGARSPQHVAPARPAGPQAGSQPASNAKVSSSADDPPWVALTIEPQVSKIRVDHPLPLKAMAEEDQGNGPTEINAEVVWTSSNRSAVSVSKDGVATALPVTGESVITATLRDGTLQATLTLAVEFAPVLGPGVLKSIDLSPKSVQATVGFGIRLKAMATFSDGPPRDVTKLVDWSVSRPELLLFSGESDPGYAAVQGAGTLTVSVSMSGVRSNDVAVVLKEPPPPPKPPVWLERIDFKPDLSGNSLEIGQTIVFVATALMSDGSTKVVTDRLGWHPLDRNVLSFEKPGVLKAKGAGYSAFSVDEGAVKFSDFPVYGSATAYGPPLKHLPKPAATGALTAKSAHLMVENIKWLGQPGYLAFGQKVDPGSLPSTGQAPLDALLKLAGDVIRLWWNLATLLAARQIWSVVYPRLQALLKEAAKPAVGLTVKELDPAYDALVGMNDFATDPGRGGSEQNYVRKTTPFGILETLWADRLPLEDMISSYDEARSLLPGLQATLRNVEAKTNALPKVVRSLDALHAEITARASEAAEREAKPVELESHIVEILTKDFGDLERDIKNVQQHVSLAFDQVNIESSRKGIEGMKREAAEAHARINMLVDGLQTITTTVLDPKSGLVAVMDLAQDLFENYVATDLADKIKRLEDSTLEYAISSANEQYQLCESDLRNVKIKMDEVKTLLDANLKDLQVLQLDVDTEYDKNLQQGKFSLRQLAAVFEVAVAAGPSAAPVTTAADDAAAKTARLMRLVAPQTGELLYHHGNRTILEAVLKHAREMSDVSAKAGARIEEIRRSLMQIRAVAYKAVFSSKFDRAEAAKRRHK